MDISLLLMTKYLWTRLTSGFIGQSKFMMCGSSFMCIQTLKGTSRKPKAASQRDRHGFILNPRDL